MKMILPNIQLWIAILLFACANGVDINMYKNLDSEQEHELLDLDADIDPQTGVRRYDNYQLLRVNPSTEEHVKILEFLEKGMVDIWNPISPNVSLIDHADLMVAPKHAVHVKDYLKCSGMEVKVISENLQRQIDEENIPAYIPPVRTKVNVREKVSPSSFNKNIHRYPRHFQGFSQSPFQHYIHKRSPGTFGDLLMSVFLSRPQSIRQGRHLRQNTQSSSNSHASFQDVSEFTPGNCLTLTKMSFQNYHGVNKIHGYLNCLNRTYSDKVSVFDIGSSTEGRPMKVIKIGTPTRDGRVKPAVWIDAGIHAREWVSPASVLYFIHQLVESPSEQDDFVMGQLDLYILPSANPDGYEYSRKRDRMWRKTRSNTGSSCIGVDPNRNWGYKWGGKGASNNPCTETYRGSKAFSEPETRSIANFILKTINKGQQIKMYLTVHSYGQYFLYPWGYERKDTPDRGDLHSMGQVGAAAIRRVNGNRKYKIGSAAKMLYPASGGSDDWAKGGAGIKYSYTIELPDTGAYGFLLPSHRIKGVGKETHAGFIAMFQKLILDKTG